MLTLLNQCLADLRHVDVELGEGSEAASLGYAFD
jgi:hypothetical protein